MASFKKIISGYVAKKCDLDTQKVETTITKALSTGDDGEKIHNIITEALDEKFDIESDEVISKFFKMKLKDFNSYGTTPKKNTNNDGEKHTCVRVKRGQTEPCGKNAKNEYDGQWYCGTEKSGCYKCIIGAAARKSANDNPSIKRTSGSSKTSKSTGTLEDRKKNAAKKSQTLIQKVNESRILNIRKVEMSNGKSVFMEEETRILFNPKTKEAYGKLNKKQTEIKKLSDENIRWLEANNHSIKQEESDDESEDEEEEGSGGEMSESEEEDEMSDSDKE